LVPTTNVSRRAQGLLQTQGGFEITGDDDFAALMQRFDGDAASLRHAGSAAGSYVKSRAGATQKVIQGIRPL
jgi:3-deoxy-D-manno-octulosonic-acid transferase